MVDDCGMHPIAVVILDVNLAGHELGDRDVSAAAVLSSNQVPVSCSLETLLAGLLATLD